MGASPVLVTEPALTEAVEVSAAPDVLAFAVALPAVMEAVAVSVAPDTELLTEAVPADIVAFAVRLAPLSAASVARVPAAIDAVEVSAAPETLAPVLALISPKPEGGVPVHEALLKYSVPSLPVAAKQAAMYNVPVTPVSTRPPVLVAGFCEPMAALFQLPAVPARTQNLFVLCS
jgi:hypothetical protein